MKTATKLNKRERRAAALLAHYATCERLALALGMPASKVDGKKISVALLKLERQAHAAAEAQCNGDDCHLFHTGETQQRLNFRDNESAWDFVTVYCEERLAEIFALPVTRSGPGTIPGFFVNGDPRGYALKIDSGRHAGETPNPAARELIDSCGMQTDWGGYGILSPDITGD